MKRSTRIKLTSACALLGIMVAGEVQGATIRYKASGDYFVTTNDTANAYGWMNPTPPGPNDLARFNYANNTVTLSDVAPLINQFQMGVDESGGLEVNSGGVLITRGGANSTVGNNPNSGVIGRLTVNAGGQVTVTNVLFVGASATGILKVDGGTVTVTSHLWSGSAAPGVGNIYISNGGVLNIWGNIGLGTINASTASGGKASVYVQEGGVLNLTIISPTNSIQPNSVLDVSGSGIVTAPNDLTTLMSYYTNVGRITAYGGLGKVGIDYNTMNAGKTTLFAIPPETPPPAEIVWNPAGNPSGTGKWNEAANWTGFVAPAIVTKVTFNVLDAIPCTVTNAAVANQIVMGDNGPGGTLIIADGGLLTCSPDIWSSIGYDSNALMIVESGGAASFGNHLWIGLNPGGDGTLTMNGGTVSVSGMFGMGWGGGKGKANIHGGTLNLAQWNDFGSIVGESVLDVAGDGRVVINGNRLFSIETYISYGQITANGGAGTVAVDYNNLNVGKTTIYVLGTYIEPEQAVWNPAQMFPDVDGLWNVSSNWTGGMGPGGRTKTVFNIVDAIPCTITNAAIAKQIAMGSSSGPGGTLIVTNSGSLSCVSTEEWSAVAYSSNALMIVESGSSASFGYHLWIGFNPEAKGTLLINGGTVSVAGAFGLGFSGGTGTVHVNSGTLNLARWNGAQSIQGASVLNITGTGKVNITGDQTSSVTEHISGGRITANGGSTVYYRYDSGTDRTVISALPLAPPRQLITDIEVNGSNVSITYQTTAGNTYYIESAAALPAAVWAPVTGSTNTGTGAPVTFSFPAGSGQRFYRTVSP